MVADCGVSPWLRLSTATPSASSTRIAQRGSIEEAIPPPRTSCLWAAASSLRLRGPRSRHSALTISLSWSNFFLLIPPPHPSFTSGPLFSNYRKVDWESYTQATGRNHSGPPSSCLLLELLWRVLYRPPAGSPQIHI